MYSFAKGQINPKAEWCAKDSLKKQTKKLFFFAKTVGKYLKLEIKISSFKYFWTFMAKKTNSFIHFLRESKARLSDFGFIRPLVI